MTSRGGIWIQGAGEMASATAVCLHRAGYRIIMAEMARPLAVRRQVCFSEAVFSGVAMVEGIEGRLCATDLAAFLDDFVTVIVDPAASALPRVRPTAVVDARMTKREPLPLPRGDLPLVGLGPGFCCGRNADLVIETHRAAGPGRIIEQGIAEPDTGVPGEVGGYDRERVLRAPVAGQLRAHLSIGDLVRKGQSVGEVGGQPVISGLEGLVRGLIHPQATFGAGDKIGDIDPRGAAVDPRRVTDKGLAIGEGVRLALARLGAPPPSVPRGG